MPRFFILIWIKLDFLTVIEMGILFKYSHPMEKNYVSDGLVRISNRLNHKI